MLHCDHCGTEAKDEDFVHVMVHVQSGRLNVIRGWRFCGNDCRSQWWNESTEDKFIDVHPTAIVVEGKNPTTLGFDFHETASGVDFGAGIAVCDHEKEKGDRDLTVDVYHYAFGCLAPPSVPEESSEHRCPCDLNKWWQSG